MIETKRKWIVSKQPSQNEINDFKNEMNFSDAFSSLCLQRGLNTKEAYNYFVNMENEPLHSGLLLGEMAKAIERIKQAVELKQKIVVFGDYDADGVTSTAILVEALREIHAQVDYVIPNRFVHGYGPNLELFEEIIDDGAEVILTCDNGVSGHAAIEYANERNVDVIVTDHHEIPEILPAAYAIVHPRLPGFSYPFHDLSGAGVAYKFATVLLGKEPKALLDLAAIGTIADLVSLTDENRILVKRGLKQLKISNRLGLKALFDVSKEEQMKANETTVGFSLGPRLNAAGRLGEASPAVQLLLATEAKEANALANHLNVLNEERKTLVDRLTKEAILELDNQTSKEDAFIILQGHEWHEGVLGIVASRIVDKTGKPTFVLNINEETQVAKGSGRSIEGINLYESVIPFTEHLKSFGGHHMAAGISIPLDYLSEFKKELNESYKKENSLSDLKEEITIDLFLSPSDATIQLIKEFETLAPFGTGNEAPVIQFNEVKIKNVKQIGAEENHLKMNLSTDDVNLDAIGFGMPGYKEKMGFEPLINVVGILEINEWRNNRKPQLMIKDICTKGTQYFDMRSKNLIDSVINKKKTDILFFNSKSKEKMESKLFSSTSSYLISNETANAFKSTAERVLLADCPPSLSILKETLRNTSYTDIYMHFGSEEDVYLNGLPSRQDFGSFYKYLLTHPNIPLDKLGKSLGSYLKIDESQFSFMISVFFEANFVTINNGLISPVENPTKIELTKTEAYKQREEFLHTQKILQFSSFSDVVSLLMSWKQTVGVE